MILKKVVLPNRLFSQCKHLYIHNTDANFMKHDFLPRMFSVQMFFPGMQSVLFYLLSCFEQFFCHVCSANRQNSTQQTATFSVYVLPTFNFLPVLYAVCSPNVHRRFSQAFLFSTHFVRAVH